MKGTFWESGKRSAGWVLAKTGSKYSYRNCIFLFAHMRCGSTALSNILCSRDEISGYGEAHISYDGQGALGRLALNQMRRGGWKPGPPFLFDKILHSRHDQAAPKDFAEARAIFMARRPAASIRSICRLYAGLRRDEYATHEQAAAYYIERLDALHTIWQRFPPHRRVGLTHASLMQDPDHALMRISKHLGFVPPLENRYTSSEASRTGGGGDPLTSGKHTKIETSLLRKTEEDDPLELGSPLLQAADERYERFRDLLAPEWADLAAP